MGVELAYYGQIHVVEKTLSKSQNGRGAAQKRCIGGWKLAMRRREAAVRGQEPPGTANLRVFRCVAAKSRVWQLATWAHALFPALHKARPAEGRPLPPDTRFFAPSITIPIPGLAAARTKVCRPVAKRWDKYGNTFCQWARGLFESNSSLHRGGSRKLTRQKVASICKSHVAQLRLYASHMWHMCR